MNPINYFILIIKKNEEMDVELEIQATSKTLLTVG